MKVLLTLLFLIFCQIVEAQTSCGTIPLSSNEKLKLRNALQATSANAPINGITVNGITYVAVKPHIVRRTDGTGGLDLATLNSKFAELNKDFLPQNLQFYFCDAQPNYINNTTYFDLGSQGSNLYNAYGVTNAINVFIVNSISSTVGGYASYPVSTPSGNSVYLSVSLFGTSGWQHEFGHYFGLYHTFEDSNATPLSLRETVTRTGSSANCSSAGDQLCDTPADPYYRFYYPVVSNGIYSSGGCNYTGTINGVPVVDANGSIYSPQLGNIMSYWNDYCKPNLFTPNQYNRIGQGLSLRLSYASLSGSYNIEGCPQTVMLAPSNVVVSNITIHISGTYTVITWTDNSTNEMGYIIERSTLPTSGFVPIEGVAPNNTTFTDYNIVSGTKYYYRVKASNTANNYSYVASNGDCTVNQIITAPNSSTRQTIQSSNTIASTSQISGNYTVVEYRAATKITLNQGFKVGSGATFKGILQACVSGARKSAELQTSLSNDEILDGNELIAYPNPTSNGEVIVQYTLPEDGNFSVYLANMSGINIKTILEDKFHEKGTYKVKATVNDIKSGIYLYILQGDKVRLAKKLIIE